MRVVYPYVRRFPEALDALPSSAEQTYVGPSSEAYWRLLRDLWHSGDDFLIVEQDMVLPTGALEAFQACPREWCGQPYFMYGAWGCWHGATRYRASLTSRLPDLPDEIKRRHWQALDSAWINHLRLAGYNEAHWHWPPAKHLSSLHPEPSHLVSCPRCGEDVSRMFGQELGRLTDDGPMSPYLASLRLTMTDAVL